MHLESYTDTGGTPKMSLKNVILAGFSCLCLWACASSPPEGQACTLIGCEDGLNLKLDPMPASFTLRLSTGDGQLQVLNCPSEGPQEAICFPDQVFVPRFTPDSLIVDIQWEDQELKGQVLQPEYSVQRPNGPGCEPACRQGQASLKLP